MKNSEEASLKIWVGRHVELDLRYENSEVERLSLDIVENNAADFDNGLLGENTPLAKAILGKQAGDVVVYRAGDIVEVRIHSVVEKQNTTPIDLSGRREEVTRKAIRQSDHSSLVIYASSMNSKWGEYDPDALKAEDED